LCGKRTDVLLSDSWNRPTQVHHDAILRFHASGPQCARAAPATRLAPPPVIEVITLWFLLRAFASDCTALADLEAASSGEQPFARPFENTPCPLTALFFSSPSSSQAFRSPVTWLQERALGRRIRKLVTVDESPPAKLQQVCFPAVRIFFRPCTELDDVLDERLTGWSTCPEACCVVRYISPQASPSGNPHRQGTTKNISRGSLKKDRKN
jgi:hypothetical protein